MSAIPYHKKLARVLDRMGGLYTTQDLLNAIAVGKMQSFVAGDSWAITQISVFPRARVLEILAIVGDLKDIDALQNQIVAFADKIDVSLIQTHGRRGWLPHALERGWKMKTHSFVYQKEL